VAVLGVSWKISLESFRPGFARGTNSVGGALYGSPSCPGERAGRGGRERICESADADRSVSVGLSDSKSRELEAPAPVAAVATAVIDSEGGYEPGLGSPDMIEFGDGGGGIR